MSEELSICWKQVGSRVCGGCSVSSASAYGRNAEARIDETAPLRARSAYGASKVAAEIIAGAYEATQGLEVVLLRPSWVYGPRRKTACVIRTMILDALAGGVTRLPLAKDFLGSLSMWPMSRLR